MLNRWSQVGHKLIILITHSCTCHTRERRHDQVDHLAGWWVSWLANESVDRFFCFTGKSVFRKLCFDRTAIFRTFCFERTRTLKLIWGMFTWGRFKEAFSHSIQWSMWTTLPPSETWTYNLKHDWNDMILVWKHDILIITDPLCGGEARDRRLLVLNPSAKSTTAAQMSFLLVFIRFWSHGLHVRNYGLAKRRREGRRARDIE